MVKSTIPEKSTEKPTVWVTHRWPDAVEAALCKDFNVVLNQSDRAMTSQQLSSALQTADAVLLDPDDHLGSDAFYSPHLRTRIIANSGVDDSAINLIAAQNHGITVTNTPNTDANQISIMAELAITLLLRTVDQNSRKADLPTSDAWGGWFSPRLLKSELSGKVLGIIGFDLVDLEVARRAHQEFGMRIIAYDPSPMNKDTFSASSMEITDTLDNLLSRADVVLTHNTGYNIGYNTGHNTANSSNPTSDYLIDAQRLNQMKPTAFLINTSNGPAVDHQALIQALWFETIAGAGLAMSECEFSPQFKNCDNAVVLPHPAGTASQKREAIGFRMIQNLKDFFAGNRPQDLISENFIPENLKQSSDRLYL